MKVRSLSIYQILVSQTKQLFLPYPPSQLDQVGKRTDKKITQPSTSHHDTIFSDNKNMERAGIKIEMQFSGTFQA